ncbi:MAG: cyclic nucleotide-binding domain-containing protein [Candidatus Wallbacteria bacterium]|nr:cyclic nucleotide-binding domain-containing protein [Candidatus Wallbacteria bacterium]
MKRNLNFHKILEKPELREELYSMLRGIPIFAELSQEELHEVLVVMQHVLFAPGETIFEQESRDRNLHLVLNGEVFLVIQRLGGAQDILARVAPRKAFGEIAFTTGARRSAGAMSGPAGSEHLVLTPEEFNNFLSHHPQITFKTMAGILGDINSRAAFMPKDLANYAVWGYMRQHDPESIERLRPGIVKRGILTFVLLLGGVFAGMRLTSDLDYRIHGTVSRIAYFKPMTIGGLAFAGTVLGFFVGTLWDSLDRITARSKRSDRCCMNCKYIHWDEVDTNFRCVYKEMQLSHTKVEPGDDFDTFTPCPSFAYKGQAKIKMRDRDGLADGRD